jgi:hypothetical protein
MAGLWQICVVIAIRHAEGPEVTPRRPNRTVAVAGSGQLEIREDLTHY